MLALGQRVRRADRTTDRRRGLGVGREVGHELVEQPPGHGRRHDRVAGRDHADRVQQLLGRHVLQQEPLAPARRPANTYSSRSKVVRMTTRGVGSGTRGDPAGRLHPVHARHAHVHEHDVDRVVLQRGERLHAVGRLAHDLEVGLGVEHHAEAHAQHRLVVDEQDADGHAGARGSITTPATAAARRHGSRHPGARPVSTDPP